MTNAPLISRLVEAKEGTRELSDEVLKVFGWNTIEAGPRGPATTKWLRPDNTGFVENRPDPTRNLQDAVALVPEGWNITIEIASFQNAAWLNKAGESVKSDYGTNRAPALSLCIAILKAMETEGG